MLLDDMFNLIALSKTLESEPKYRLTQARQALFGDLISDWKQASSLPLELRQRLNSICPLVINAKFFNAASRVVTKALVKFDDGLSVECVLMRSRSGRQTVCVSSQVGCPLGCAFCATGAMGFKRNLSSEEIVAQVLVMARRIKPERVSHVVLMGMGEPLLNFEAVWQAVALINSSLGIAARHISISSAGIIGGIKALAHQSLQVNLAISLHAPTDALRRRIMPVASQASLVELFQAVDYYIAQTGRRVMFEYLMLSGVNDSQAQARQLAKLMAKPLYLVNLLKYNPTGSFEASEPATIKKFRQILENSGVAVTQRHSFGAEIDAACGQLAKIDSAK